MHNPVMLNEVVEKLAPCDQETYIDATFGRGGYTKAFLEKAKCSVVAIDRDPEVFSQSQFFKTRYGERFSFYQGPFGQVAELVPSQKYDGIVFDLGVSSMQLDNPDRGFSFKMEGPLDMRMEKKGQSAADVVNTFKEEELSQIFWTYGEERRSRAIARAIVKKREKEPFATTKELADLVRAVVGFERPGFDPATRTFQALRLFVNDELKELRQALEASEGLLKGGGRLVVVSFHSLEDRIVKDFLKEKSGRLPRVSRHFPEEPQIKMTFEVKTQKALMPTEEEMRRNPRARSARLRWAIRCEKEM